VKILLSTYSAETHSSYGKVTRELWKRLTQMNPEWNVIQHGWLHRPSEPVPWEIHETQMATTQQGRAAVREDKFGALSFEPLVRRFRPDVVWSLADAFMVDYIPNHMGKYGFKYFLHTPIDGAPIPESWRPPMKAASEVVPVTQFGQDALTDAIGRSANYIYHGVDIEQFKPISREDQRAQRPEPTGTAMDRDAFVLGFVGHTQYRKQNWNMFQIMRYLIDGTYVICNECDRVTLVPLDPIKMKPRENVAIHQCSHCSSIDIYWEKPRHVVLWYHTFERPNTEYSPTNLKNIWDLEGRVIFTDQMEDSKGRPDAEMPHLFRMFDAYLALSGGEGFCIPIIECYASGVPVVYCNYSGHGEVGAYAGVGVDYYCLQPNVGEPINRAIPNIEQSIREVVRLMDNEDHYKSTRQRGIVAARDKFSWDLVAAQWSTFINENASRRKHETIGHIL